MQRFTTLVRFLVLFVLLLVGAANRPAARPVPVLSDAVSALLRSVTPSNG